MSSMQYSKKVANFSDGDIQQSITLAKNLKILRERRGLSHARLSAELAKRNFSIKPNSLINYEVTETAHTKFGKNLGMSAKNLNDLSRFYDVSVDYLLGLTNDPEPKKSVVDKLAIDPVAVGLLQTYRNEFEGRGLAKLCEHLAFRTACKDIGKLIKLCSTEYVPGRNVCYEGISNPDLVERFRADDVNRDIQINYPDMKERSVFLSGSEYRDFLVTRAQNFFVRALQDITQNAEEGTVDDQDN